MSFFVPLLGLFKGPGLKVLFNPKVHGLSAALNGKYHIMVYTQLADRENKLTAARKLIKYYMSFKCVSWPVFSYEVCFDNSNEIKNYRAQTWGIFIGKGVSVYGDQFHFHIFSVIFTSIDNLYGFLFASTDN